MEKTNFNKWNKKALIDLLKFFEYNFPINFKEVMNRFEEWKRGDWMNNAKKESICPVCEKEIAKHSTEQFLVCQNRLQGEMAGVWLLWVKTDGNIST